MIKKDIIYLQIEKCIRQQNVWLIQQQNNWLNELNCLVVLTKSEYLVDSTKKCISISKFA